MSAPANKTNSRSSVLAPGAILQNRYRIIRQLGKGGMGAVYEAVDQRLDAIVALKETFSVDDRLRQQFEQEARLLAQLQHQALPRVSDYFTEGERAFLVMQFISGADLAEIIVTQPGPFPRNVVITWADQLLDALIYLHTRDRQIIHRDIKPHNLKVTSTGQIALLDFGLAKAQSADVSSTNSSTSIFGYSRRYSPPEQIQDQGTTPRSDIYALGATLYHLLTGVKPPDALVRAGALANSKSDPLQPANEVHRAVGPEIAAILNRAMALSPEDRYASASEFRGALRRVGRMETLAGIKPDGVFVATAADVSTNTTVVRRDRVAVVDPFDSYSILKPAETDWLIPKHGLHPAVIAVVVTILLTAGVGTFYGFGHLLRSADSVLDYARANAGKDERGAATAHQSKSEKPRVNSSGAASVPATSARESNRKNDARKTRSGKANNTNSRTPSVVAPPLAIPALQTMPGAERNR